MNRLPLALFLSFLVLFVWLQMVAPPPEPTPQEGPGVEATGGPDGDANGGAGGATTSGSGEAGAPAAEERPGRRVADEEREEVIQIGVPAANGGPKEPGHYWMRFSNRGGRLEELRFLDYVERAEMTAEERTLRENWTPLLLPFEGTGGATGSLLLEASESARTIAPESLSDVLWEMERLPAPEEGVRFTYAPGTGVVFVKTIRTVPGTWRLTVALEIRNESAGDLGRASFTMIPAGVVPPALDDAFYLEPTAVAVGRDKRGRLDLDQQRAPGAKSEGGRLNAGTEGLAFAGVHNKYFAFLLRDAEGHDTLRDARWDPVVERVSGFEEREPEENILTRVQLDLDLPDQGESRTWEWVAYAGPKDPDVFRADLEAHDLILEEDLSTFSTIGRFLLWVLRTLQSFLGNWGVAIIVMTICVRIVLFPLNRRSQTAMARYQTKMKRVQPKIDELKKKYEGDPQKQREAQARLMQEEGAFPPLGGCLPMFLQIPIFFGLFSALRTSWDLRQADFAFWIHDLSLPDRLLELGVTIPLLFFEFDLTYLNLLPLIMVVLWILQQKGMPQPSDPQAKQMQKIMMFMPILFGVFLYNYAAGLSLYMITQSGLGIIEQRVIKKLWPIDDAELEVKKKAGCGPFSGTLEKLQEQHKQQMEVLERQRRQKAQTQKRRKKR